jgi:hypothetical protein
MTTDMEKNQIDYGDYILYPYEGKVWTKKQKRFLKGTNVHGYVYIQVSNTRKAVHRMMYEAFHAVTLTKNQHINHINRQRDDNRISNLEIVTIQQNSQWITNRTGNYKGVAWNKDHNKWKAELKYNNVNHFLGYHDTELDGAKKYNDYAMYLNQTQDCKYLLNEIPDYVPNPCDVPAINRQNIIDNQSCADYIGVQYNKQRNNFYSQIKYNGKSYFLGSHCSAIECAKLYNQQAAYFNTKNPTIKYELNVIPDYVTIPKDVAGDKITARVERKKSKYIGVVPYDERWRAYITHNKKQIFLGTFTTELEAANAYNTKAAELNTNSVKKYKTNNV